MKGFALGIKTASFLAFSDKKIQCKARPNALIIIKSKMRLN